MQKSIVDMYNNNNQLEDIMEEKNPICHSDKKVIYVRVNLTNIHSLYEPLLKNSKVCWNKWKDIFCPWLACLNIIKMSVLSKMTSI